MSEPGREPREVGGVDSSWPIGLNVVLESTQFRSAVEDGGETFGTEAVLVGIARDGSNPINAEVEWLSLKACLIEERYEERAETAVNVKQDVVSLG